MYKHLIILGHIFLLFILSSCQTPERRIHSVDKEIKRFSLELNKEENGIILRGEDYSFLFPLDKRAYGVFISNRKEVYIGEINIIESSSFELIIFNLDGEKEIRSMAQKVWEEEKTGFKNLDSHQIGYIDLIFNQKEMNGIKKQVKNEGINIIKRIIQETIKELIRNC